MTRPTFAVLVHARYACQDVRPGTDPAGAWKKATGMLLLAAREPEFGLELRVSYRVSCLNAQNAIHYALTLLERDMGKAGLVTPTARPVSIRVESDLAEVALPDEQVAA